VGDGGDGLDLFWRPVHTSTLEQIVMWNLSLLNWDPSHVLTWADYPKVDTDPTGNGYIAFTTLVSEPFRYNTASSTEGTITMDFRLDPTRSWVLRSWVEANHNPDTVLDHERGHYNIALLITRDVVAVAPSMSIADGIAFMNLLGLRWSGLDDGVPGCYERSTNLGENAGVQAQWDTLIAAALSANPPATADFKSSADAQFDCRAS
jgi:hypothetical protein